MTILELGTYRVERETLTYRCPGCKRLSHVTVDAVSDDGLVNPHVKCSFDDCFFYGTLLLDRWPELRAAAAAGG